MAQQDGDNRYEILGAVKIKDGLFIGDELAAQDLEFVVANKVSVGGPEFGGCGGE